MVSAWMLPARHRERYRHVFAAELHHVHRGERLRFSLRVLSRTWTLHAALTAQPNTIGVEAMATKSLRCRVGLHAWKMRRNTEDAGRYQECIRCTKQRDLPTVSRAGGFAGLG